MGHCRLVLLLMLSRCDYNVKHHAIAPAVQPQLTLLSVSWQWSGSRPGGKAAEVKTQGEVSIETHRGNTVKKNAEPNNPAVKIERSGNNVVKKASELKVDKAGDKHKEAAGEEKEVSKDESKKKDDKKDDKKDEKKDEPKKNGTKRKAEDKDEDKDSDKKAKKTDEPKENGTAKKGKSAGTAKKETKKKEPKKAATESGEPRRSGRNK